MSWEKNTIRHSVCCNGDLVRSLREGKGWTQEVLAKESGYGKRVISKAENGQSVLFAVINTLAEALSIALHEVSGGRPAVRSSKRRPTIY